MDPPMSQECKHRLGWSNWLWTQLQMLILGIFISKLLVTVHTRCDQLEESTPSEKMKWLIALVILAGLGHGIVIEQVVI